MSGIHYHKVRLAQTDLYVELYAFQYSDEAECLELEYLEVVPFLK